MLTAGQIKEANKKEARELRKADRAQHPKKSLPPRWNAFFEMAKSFRFNLPVPKKRK